MIRLLGALVFVVMTMAGQAQSSINSPYTRFGLGWIVESRFETRMMGMGGVRYGMQEESLLNPANPASYAAFDSISFIFQGGVFGVATRLNTIELSQSGNFVSMSHLLFGFQVTKWWKTSFGVLPFSFVGYDVIVESSVEDIGPVSYLYEGSGGFNTLYWGNAFPIYKGLSGGFNLKYLFGKIYHERAVAFEDPYLKNTRVRSAFNANDFFIDLGLQYKHRLNDEYSVTGGLSYTNETKIRSEHSQLTTSYFGSINSVQAYRDTILYSPPVSGEFVLPAKVGAGLSFVKKNHITAGVDFTWQNWERFSSFNIEDSLKNSWSVAVGGELIPDITSIRSYFSKVRYRMGFRYGSSFLELNDTRLKEFGITFGLGFPVKRSRTTLNVALEAGRMGTTGAGLIQENFVRFTFGVNIFENWFIKSKYY